MGGATNSSSSALIIDEDDGITVMPRKPALAVAMATPSINEILHSHRNRKRLTSTEQNGTLFACECSCSLASLLASSPASQCGGFCRGMLAGVSVLALRCICGLSGGFYLYIKCLNNNLFGYCIYCTGCSHTFLVSLC